MLEMRRHNNRRRYRGVERLKSNGGEHGTAWPVMMDDEWKRREWEADATEK